MKTIMLIICLTQMTLAQQIGDSTYNPHISNPMYEISKGPIIYVDEAHNNFHTISGRYKPFAQALTKDGYVVKPFNSEFSVKNLKDGKILVISNALSQRNAEDWTLPTLSAFTDSEIDQLTDWVKGGGNLFLIADHMPFPGCVSGLAERFGFKLNNGFAFDTTNKQAGDLFTKSDNTLQYNIITAGRNESETVDSIYSFRGEAFQIPNDAIHVLTLNKNFISLMPDTAWVFKENTPKISVSGWSQGAVKNFGKGRVAIWGEAAMFSAQLANGQRFGMNAPYAKYNLQMLLNIIHWLDNK